MSFVCYVSNSNDYWLQLLYFLLQSKKKLSIAKHMHRGSWQITQVEISAQCLYLEGEEVSLCFCPPCVENSKRCSSRLNLL